jgi:hypothetical protein
MSMQMSQGDSIESPMKLSTDGGQNDSQLNQQQIDANIQDQDQDQQ